MKTQEDAKKRTIERLACELAGHMNHQAKKSKVVTFSSTEKGTEVTFTHRGKRVEISDPDNALPMGVKNAVTTAKQAASYKAYLVKKGFFIDNNEEDVEPEYGLGYMQNRRGL